MQAISDPDGLSISFNQDATCACISSKSGISVYSFESGKIVFTTSVGSIRLCRMLFSTSLLAYVGSGDQVNLSPRKLVLLNTRDQQVIQDLKFKSAVLAIRLNKRRLIAVLETQAKVYALESLDHLSTIETSSNPQGLCALTNGPETSLLALPSHSHSGSIQVSDTLNGGQAVAEIQAHKSSLAALSFNEDGSLIASSSNKGTVIRIHSLPKGQRVHQLRRGSTQAKINCLAFFHDTAFSLLACTSSHGTVHVWRLEVSIGRTQSGFLSSVIPSSMTDIVDPQRSMINLRVPTGIPMECALKRLETREQSSEDSSSEKSRQNLPQARVNLLLVTKNAMLYKYCLQGLAQGQNPSSILVSEQSLLKTSTDSVYHN